MREIKFRGKRVDNGEWIEGGLFQKEKNGMSIKNAIDNEQDLFYQ